MSKKIIKLKHKYRTRSGLNVKLFVINDSKYNKLYPVVGMVQTKSGMYETNTWTVNGLNQSNVTDGQYDLVRMKKKKHKKSKKIDLGKTYVTREGLPVKLCCVDEMTDPYFSLVGHFKENGKWYVAKWTEQGKWFYGSFDHKRDLILATEYDSFENRKC